MFADIGVRATTTPMVRAPRTEVGRLAVIKDAGHPSDFLFASGACRYGGCRLVGVEPGRPPLGRSWTLVDVFDRDGARYIVARENRPPADGLAALSDRERQVVEHLVRDLSTKEIAFALGIAAVTVRVLIRRATAKLGATSRSSLLAQVAARRSPSSGGTGGAG